MACCRIAATIYFYYATHLEHSPPCLRVRSNKDRFICLYTLCRCVLDTPKDNKRRHADPEFRIEICVEGFNEG